MSAMHSYYFGICFVVLILPCAQTRPANRTTSNLDDHRWNHPCSANSLPVLHAIVISVLPANQELPDYDIRRILSSSLMIIKETIEIVNSALVTIEGNIPHSPYHTTARNMIDVTTSRVSCSDMTDLISRVFYDGFPRCSIQNLCTPDVYRLEMCYEDLQLTVIALERLALGSLHQWRAQFPSEDVNRLITKIYEVMCFLLDVKTVLQNRVDLGEFYSLSNGRFEEVGTMSGSDFQELSYISLRGMKKLLSHLKSIIDIRISILQ